jgi:hypothetical protein
MAKGETVMPTPEGIITTSDIYVTEPAVEVEDTKEEENDLPELS